MTKQAIQVLLIDDDEGDSLLTQDLLGDIGTERFEVKWCSTYAEGLAALSRGEHDICLLDYRLGAKTGLDLLREAKSAGSPVPVILLTGQSEREIDFSAMQLGAADFLEKQDLSAPKLERAIRYALLKHRQAERLESEIQQRTSDLERIHQTLQSEIDQRQRTAAALTESEARFRHLADAMPQIVWVCDAQGRLEFLNRQWCSHTGLSLQDMRTLEGMAQVVHPDDWPRVAENWQQARRRRVAYQVELRIRHASDQQYCWFLFRSVPIFDEQGRLTKWYGTGTDIHDHKVLEAQQREASRRKDEFLASLGHELRNPLPPMRNALEIMRLSQNDPVAVERGRQMIERQLQQLIRLIDDLLDLSRFTRGKIRLLFERVDLRSIFDVAAETTRPLMEAAHHRFTISKPEQAVYFQGDSTRLTQVLVNLLNNAAKYTEPRGEIHLAGCRQDDHILIGVRDNGIGITPDLLPHVFDMFTQDNRSDPRVQGGLGIGLALVRSIVQMHGGTVEARSDGTHRGSEFIVRLPLEQPEDRLEQQEVDLTLE